MYMMVCKYLPQVCVTFFPKATFIRTVWKINREICACSLWTEVCLRVLYILAAMPSTFSLFSEQQTLRLLLRNDLRDFVNEVRLLRRVLRGIRVWLCNCTLPCAEEQRTREKIKTLRRRVSLPVESDIVSFINLWSLSGIFSLSIVLSHLPSCLFFPICFLLFFSEPCITRNPLELMPMRMWWWIKKVVL